MCTWEIKSLRDINTKKQTILARERRGKDEPTNQGKPGWMQYRSHSEHKDEKRQISINMATIHGLAKKLIAREWSRVWGKTVNYGWMIKNKSELLKRRKKL